MFQSCIPCLWGISHFLIFACSGDHTVKITNCTNGTLHRNLFGHRRTPWVVRFHPRDPHLLASGSLDHEVRLWDAATGKCLAKHLFGKPIASLAFHVAAPLVAIACGHKLYMWEYTIPGVAPSIVLRTRRSMRAVHFHPHGLPLILTAEVQDPSPTSHLSHMLTEEGPFVASGVTAAGDVQQPETLSDLRAPPRKVTHPMVSLSAPVAAVLSTVASSSCQDANRIEGPVQYSQQPLPPSMVPTGLEVPFPCPTADIPTTEVLTPTAVDGIVAQLAAAYSASMWNILGEDQPPRVRLRLWRFDASKPAADLENRMALRMEIQDAVLCSEMGVHFSPCGRFLAATVACRGPLYNPAAAAAAVAAAERAVEAMDWAPARETDLREGGGETAGEPAVAAASSSAANPIERPATPTRPNRSTTQPLAPRQGLQRVLFEVRVMSMDGTSWGEVVLARRVRAAHCLTSVQFSPAGDHLLLAYGKKHSSLLRSLVVERDSLVPLHTILEVVSLSAMSLVRVLPSVDDEINAACFHPAAGGGFAYGTKEGRLRLVRAKREQPGEDEVVQQRRVQPGAALLQQGWVPVQQFPTGGSLARDGAGRM